MINLAGNKECDKYIRTELTRCGINVVEHPKPSGDEVNSFLTGELKGFTFQRAWRYWIVEGKMPLEAAQELYANPVGKTDIRVSGHCNCPPPEPPWVTYLDANGIKLVADPDGKQQKQSEFLLSKFPNMQAELDKMRFVVDPNADAVEKYIDSYHVDSELGLYILGQMIWLWCV